MDQLIPGLAALVAPFRDCFRSEVFQTFQILIAGWVVCVGPRTLSEVWQATGLAAKRHHDTAYAVFHSACWEWDDLGLVLATLILAHLVPGGVVWIVVDDTLCHKRGAKVAFGGIFLDAVLSTKKHKTLRFGLNWVVLGVAVPLPLRDDRYFCLPVLWRCYRKKGQAGHRSRTPLAPQFRTSEGGMARMAVSWDTPGHGGEMGRIRGEKGSFYGKFEGLEPSPVPISRPPLPPGVDVGGHGGSHGYLMNEFVTAILEGRKPLVDIATALNLTVPGIVAHQSALQRGKLLRIPQYRF